MYCRTPSNPSPSLPPGKVARASTGRPPRSLVRRLPTGSNASNAKSEGVESRVTGGATRVGPVLRQHLRAAADPSSPRRRQLGDHRRAAAGSARPACSAPPSSRASPGWSAGPARSWSGTPPSARGRRGRSGRRRRREPKRSHRPLPAACRSAGPEPDSRTCRERKGSRGSSGCDGPRPRGSGPAPRTSPPAVRR